jgi:ATP adenylyltransferase
MARARKSSSTERHRNLWAPWRIAYIEALSEPADGCFLCRHRDQAGQDKKNLVFWRGRGVFAMLNRFPYSGGHAMVAPYEHVGGLEDLDEATMLEMMRYLRDLQSLLGKAVKAQGFNIGMNVGRCAGAGLPDHLHVHVVPRWQGDTNFMSVFGGARVISQALEGLYGDLRRLSKQLKLPKAT